MQVLASIGQLEFFYDQAPDIMRSCSMAMQLLSVAIGSYLSGMPVREKVCWPVLQSCMHVALPACVHLSPAHAKDYRPASTGPGVYAYHTRSPWL